eukprot:TRINITY_DN62541_c1_g1_i1.p1 TRINITY_DN62541_c1_g1~~TRINITY_DN62541_c1_g1_i1.p1  ORF type:complete len:206 (+),score=12.91 TRINITY_DN62541_c1_g1_i1:103-720(+)
MLRTRAVTSSLLRSKRSVRWITPEAADKQAHLAFASAVTSDPNKQWLTGEVRSNLVFNCPEVTLNFNAGQYQYQPVITPDWTKTEFKETVTEGDANALGGNVTNYKEMGYKCGVFDASTMAVRMGLEGATWYTWYYLLENYHTMLAREVSEGLLLWPYIANFSFQTQNALVGSLLGVLSWRFFFADIYWAFAWKAYGGYRKGGKK